MIKGILKVISYLVGMVIAFIFIGMIVLSFSEIDTYKHYFVDYFKQATNQDLILNGPVDLKFFPIPHLALKNVTVKINVKGDVIALNAHSLSFSPEWMSLFSTTSTLNNVKIKDLSVRTTSNNQEVFSIPSFSGDLVRAPCSITLPNLSIQTPQGFVGGNVSYSWAEKNPELKGKLQLKDWKMIKGKTPFGLSLLDTLKGTTVSLNVDADKIKAPNHVLRNFSADLSLKNKMLHILVKTQSDIGAISSTIDINEVEKATYKATVDFAIKDKYDAQMAAKSHLTFKQRDNGNIRVDGSLRLDKQKASHVLKFVSQEVVLRDGVLNFSFKGQSEGKTTQEILERASGKGLLEINNMTVVDHAIGSRHANFASALLQGFLPSKKKETQIQCAVVRFSLKDKILKAPKAMGIQTDELYVLGSGMIDFNTNELAMLFKLKPKSNLNLSVGSLNNTITVKGPLQAPKVGLSKQGVVLEGGALALGFATGGMSLLAEKLFDMASKTKDPCQAVLQQN